ncbi:response regulator transcription factor [Phenylobacterium sp.]|uniref:response regulator n=1 Tax=Phenylobacterium sp. TaxID=1871053 RepID=UPI0025F23D33|nr:response regulator transcription factor [Phenylobacterium sp.]
MRLLLIEDNARLGGLVVEGLTQDGFVVDWRETLEGGIEARSLAAYDLVLLDLGLPDGDGLDLVKRLRRNHDAVPILILTARGGLGDRIAGLDVGADDYLVKPFDIAELAARCRALLRRPGACLGVVLRAGNVALDTASRSLEIGGVPVGITPRELALLEHLLRRAGQVVPKPLLEDQLYAMDAEVTPNALEVAVSRLRKRLSAAGADLMLRTAHGVGYALIAEPARAAPHG